MAIAKFEQDQGQAEGQGYFFDEKGNVVYTYDPETAASLKTSGQGFSNPASQIQTETGALPAVQSLPRPATDTSGYLASNSSAVPAVSVAAPVATPAPVSTPTAPNTAPALTMNPRGQYTADRAMEKLAAMDPYLGPMYNAGTQTQSGYSSAKGRPVANVNAQIANERSGVDQVQAANDTQADVVGGNQQKAYDTQLSGLDTSMKQTASDVGDTDLKLKQNEDMQAAISGEKDAVVDPNRVFDRMSTGKMVATTLLSTIFGALSAVGGKENTFLSTLNKAADDDIKSQEFEIQSGRITRGNRLAFYKSQGADLQQAKVMYDRDLKNAMQKYVEVQAQKESSTGVEKARADQVNAQLELNFKQRAGDLLSQTETRTTSTGGTTSTDQRFVIPQVDSLKAYELENSKRDLADADNVSIIVGQKVSPKRAKEINDSVREVSKDLAPLEETQNSIYDLVVATGASVDRKKGTIDWTNGGKAPIDLKGVGYMDSKDLSHPIDAAMASFGVGRLNSEKVRTMRQALISKVRNELSGAHFTDTETEEITAGLGGDLNNETSFREGITNALNKVTSKRNDEIGRLNPLEQKMLNYNHDKAAQGNGAPPLKQRGAQ